MIKIQKKQLDSLQQARDKQLRDAQIQSFKKQGLKVEEQQNGDILLKDKAGGNATIGTIDNGTTFTMGENRTFQFTYTKESQLDIITDPNNFQVHFKYDEQQRLIEIHRDTNTPHHFDYDENSNIKTMGFPDSTSLNFEYDNNGKLTTVEDRNKQSTFYTYAKEGQLSSQTNRNGHKTEFEDNGFDIPASIIFPTGDRYDFEYNDDGDLKKMYVNGVEHAQFESNIINDEYQTDYADGSFIQLIKDEDRIIEAHNEFCIVKFIYDKAGRIISEDVDGKLVQYAYDEIGKLKNIITPEGDKISFERDKEHRIKKVTDWSKQDYHIHYATNGALANICYPNKIQLSQETNLIGLPESYTLFSPSSVNLILSIQYTYDNCDRLLTATENGQTKTYCYDKEARLLAIKSDNLNIESFNLDAQGNCLQNSIGEHQYNSLDQCVSSNDKPYYYDALGNLTEGLCPKGFANYSFNGHNNLIGVELSGNKTRYAYDAFGRRIRKISNALVTHYIWAGQQLLSEQTLRDDSIISRRDYLIIPEWTFPLAMRENNHVYCLHPGRRSEILAMTDATAKVVWQADYKAFGEVNIKIKTVSQPWRLAGQYFDDETGLHYSLARYYDPQLGRYLSKDPLLISGGSNNFYIYCDGDPLNRKDPTGSFIFMALLLGAAIGAAVGGGIEYYRQKKAIERGEQQGYDGWGIVKSAAIGGAIGAIGGVVGAAIEGTVAATALVATIKGGAIVGGLSGVVSSVAEQCALATLNGKKLDFMTFIKEVAIDGIIGVVIGAGTSGVGSASARRVRKGIEAIKDIKQEINLKKIVVNKKIKTLKPSLSEINLAKTSGNTASHISARNKIARNYFENNGFSKDQINDALGNSDGTIIGGVDLNKPLEVVSFPPPDFMTQYVKSHGYPGNWFDPKGSQSADTLGISNEGRKLITVKIPNGNGLSSYSKPILDKWTDPKNPIQTKGGGQQVFVNDSVKNEIIKINNIGN